MTPFRARLLFSLLVCLSLSCNTLMQLVATPTSPRPASPPPTGLPTASPSPLPDDTPGPEPTPRTGVQLNAPTSFAFTLITQDSIDIYLIPSGCLDSSDCDVQDATRLTQEAGAYLPYWSPDLTRIAYLFRPANADLPDIWVVDVASAEARALTQGGVRVLGQLSWSADGRHLLYSASQPDGNELDVYRIEVATGEIANLTSDSPVWDAFPMASPLDDRIAFVSDRAPSGGGKLSDEVWVMNGDGSGLLKLTDNGFDFEDGPPAWSPGGDQIAFHRFGLLVTEDTPGSPSGLWVMKADGSDPRNLVEFIDVTVQHIVWSPDGNWIAFAYASSESNVEVWVVPAGGGDAVNVSNLPGDDTFPTWSPDSSGLLFTNSTDDAVGVYYAAIDGSDTHAVFEGEATAYADWTP